MYFHYVYLRKLEKKKKEIHVFLTGGRNGSVASMGKKNAKIWYQTM